MELIISIIALPFVILGTRKVYAMVEVANKTNHL